MLQANSNNNKLSNVTKTSKPNLNSKVTPKVSIAARSSTKKSVVGVSNISVSIRSSRKTTDSTQKKAEVATADAEKSTSEKGVQVNDIQIIAAPCDGGDGPYFMLPSAKVLQEIEKTNKLKQQAELKARLSETRKFEAHSAKEEMHLTNLKEFMDRGAITRLREPWADNPGQIDNSLKSASERTKTALEAFDRVKRKEEELLKMFNSI